MYNKGVAGGYDMEEQIVPLPPEGSEFHLENADLEELERLEEAFMIELSKHIEELPDDESRQKFIEELLERYDQTV